MFLTPYVEKLPELLDKLVNDGRINHRIEDALTKADEEIRIVIKQKGEQAADVLGLEFDPYIIEMLGRLNYRTSYGQNILDHSIECAKIAGIIADRLRWMLNWPNVVLCCTILVRPLTLFKRALTMI